jgi:hypothetical protein
MRVTLLGGVVRLGQLAADEADRKGYAHGDVPLEDAEAPETELDRVEAIIVPGPKFPLHGFSTWTRKDR